MVVTMAYRFEVDTVYLLLFEVLGDVFFSAGG
jgi:hypothetical protein